MKSYRKELWFEIPSRRGFVNITPEVEQAVRDSGVREGLVLVNAMHITASVFINDDEGGLHQDCSIRGRRRPHALRGLWTYSQGIDRTAVSGVWAAERNVSRWETWHTPEGARCATSAEMVVARGYRGRRLLPRAHTSSLVVAAGRARVTVLGRESRMGAAFRGLSRCQPRPCCRFRLDRRFFFYGPPAWLDLLLHVASALLLTLPALAVALIVYHRLTFRSAAGDGHTRCADCGHILKGLTEPRCPECGLRI